MDEYRYLLSTVATDALVLKHQVSGICSAGKYPMVWASFIKKCYSYSEKCLKMKSHSEKNAICWGINYDFPTGASASE